MSEGIRAIPLSKLMPSEANVRHTEAGAGLDELIASIKAHGLLQNLTVRSIRKPNGKQTSSFEVVAGGRRLAALTTLAANGHIPKNYSVPCQVLDGQNAVEVSLAENLVRVPLHPADQFEAFAKLHAEGAGASEIAGRFGISSLLVEQRLKLAAVSPRLMAVYRENAMSLDQLMAFTISDDQEAQERVWFDSPLHDRQPHNIRRALTRALIEGSDRRARFIGAAAYEAAGGVIVRDLFHTNDEGFFSDSQLLDRLVNEKIVRIAEELKAEGWAWIEVLSEMDYGLLARMGRIEPTRTPLSEEEEVELEQLTERYDAFLEELGEEPPEEVTNELNRLEQEIEKRSEERTAWSVGDKGRSGVILALDYNGNLRIERGLLKPEDRLVKPKTEVEPEEPTGSERSDPPDEEAKLPDAVLENLSAHRTAAIRAVLATQPQLALMGLLHTLVLRTFYSHLCETCLDVRLELIELKRFAPGIVESKALQAMANHHRRWQERLPEEQDLWPWLMEQNHETKLALLAYCIANTANAVELRYGGINERRRDQANHIARAANLDMAEWWEPTAESYFDHVTKAAILSAISEGLSSEAAENITGLKKAAMAAQAQALLAGKRWLPVPLRSRESLTNTAQA